MSGSSDTTLGQYLSFQFASRACLLPQHLIATVLNYISSIKGQSNQAAL